ncbi:MAG: preprotein translocase subunit YajC [Thermodesulfobacteriota bacterium]
MVSVAYAMGQGGAPAQGAAGGLASFIPLILMFVIFYFLLIRPQQKKAKEMREMIANLKRGDRVVTSGGIHGQIVGLDDATIHLEIADKVRIKVNRSSIAGLVGAGSAPPSKKAAEPEKAKESEPKSSE